MRTSAAAIAAGLMAALSGPALALPPGDHAITIRERAYIVHVPAKLAALGTLNILRHFVNRADFFQHP